VRINCSALAFLYGAAFLLILPLNWILSFFAAALFHELCHYMAICLTGNTVHEIVVSHDGTVMATSPMPPLQELICALAGPMGGVLLFLCYPWIPRIALCAGAQGLFNLLPLYPMDGGRIFRSLMELLCPRYAAVLCRWVKNMTIFAIFLLGLWLCAGLRLGFGPAFLIIALLSRALDGKIPCKQGKLRVQ